MAEERVRETLEAAERRFGLTDADPEFSIDCPGCGHPVEVWDTSDLPMGYECYRCAANYEIQSDNEVILIETW